MSFPTVCSHCGSSYTFKDEFQGKKIRCKKCQEIFVARMAEEELEEDDDLISKALGLDGAKEEMEPVLAQTRPPALEESVDQEPLPREVSIPLEQDDLEKDEEPMAELVEESARPVSPTPKVEKASRRDKPVRKERIKEDSWDEEREKEPVGGGKRRGSKVLAALAWSLVVLVVLAGTAPAVYFAIYPEKLPTKPIITPTQTQSTTSSFGGGRGMGAPGMGMGPPMTRTPPATAKKDPAPTKKEK